MNKHTCNQGRGPMFGKLTMGCIRCDELAAGAPRRTLAWVERKNKRDADYRAFVASLKAHDCKRARCMPICTFGDW